MSPKHPVFVVVCGFLILGLTACQPGQSADDSQSEFHVSLNNRGNVSGYLPTGWNWKPNSKVEISIWQEPDGPGSVSSQWKKILDEDVDASSMFGFSGDSPFYPVRRNICGSPVNGQIVVIMAKSLTTGMIRMRQVPADIYFTFQPCP